MRELEYVLSEAVMLDGFVGNVNHRVAESFESEWIFKDHPVQLPCNAQGHLQLYQVLRAPSSLALKVSNAVHMENVSM